MDIQSIRFSNYNLLRNNFAQRETKEGISSRGRLIRFGVVISVSHKFLSQINTQRKPIGNRTARKIEAGLSLPTGWMDVDQNNNLNSINDEGREFMSLVSRLFQNDPTGVRAAIIRYMEVKLVSETSLEL